MATWLGIDIGTSGVKVIAVRDDGQVVARGSSPFGAEANGPHHEQSPREYARAIAAAIAQCGVEPDGIGVVGQTPTLVMVDEHGDPVRDAMTWRDVRPESESQELSELLPDSRELCGVAELWDRSHMPAKLLWLARHDPAALARTAYLLQPKDFAVMALTGNATSDAWSSKGLVSVPDGHAVTDVLELAGVDSSVVPRIAEPWALAGHTTSSASERFGLPEQIPVSVGWSDALAGMVGVGAVTSPKSFVLTGTSDIVGVSGEAAGPPAEGIYRVPRGVSPLDIDYGPTQASGASLLWLSRLLRCSVEELVDSAEGAKSSALTFLPYLRGERAPLWSSGVRASFTGLSDEHDAPQLALAVMRGVVMSNRHVLDVALAGRTAEEIHVGGANVSASAWKRVRSELLLAEVVLHDEPQLPALGAAMLARSAATGTSLEESSAKLQGPVTRIPRCTDIDAANAAYSRYLRDVARSVEDGADDRAGFSPPRRPQRSRAATPRTSQATVARSQHRHKPR